MIAQTVSSCTVLFFSSEELHAHSLKPDQLTASQALSLVRAALAPFEQAMPSCPELQIFTTEKGVLLFLRPTCSQSSQFTLSPWISS